MGKYGLEHPRRPRGSQSRRDENRDWREVFNSRLVSTDCPWVSEDAQDGSRIQAEQVATIFILIGLIRRALSFCQNWPARPIHQFAKKMQQFEGTLA